MQLLLAGTPFLSPVLAMPTSSFEQTWKTVLRSQYWFDGCLPEKPTDWTRNPCSLHREHNLCHIIDVQLLFVELKGKMSSKIHLIKPYLCWLRPTAFQMPVWSEGNWVPLNIEYSRAKRQSLINARGAHVVAVTQRCPKESQYPVSTSSSTAAIWLLGNSQGLIHALGPRSISSPGPVFTRRCPMANLIVFSCSNLLPLGCTAPMRVNL